MDFIKFPYKVHTIFIMLGFACNFNCKYCTQHEFKTDKVKTVYNKKIIQFIKEQAKENEHISITFYGGEPLLYFNTIKDIVLKLKNIENISFGMITNGSLLNEETIDFINEHDISLNISWDGRNTKLSRGIDVFETNKDNIFKLKNGFKINSVLNAYNSPKTILEDIDNLNKEYKKVYNTDIIFNIDIIYYLENSNSDIFLLDFKKYKNDVEELINKYIYDNKNISYADFCFINEFLSRIKIHKERETMNYSYCESAINILNMDIQGNLYLCHNNTNKKLGTINSNIDDYHSNYKKYNSILPKYYVNNCKTCSIRFLCIKGCMLLSEDELKNFYCIQNKTIIEPIINKLIHFAK